MSIKLRWPCRNAGKQVHGMGTVALSKRERNSFRAWARTCWSLSLRTTALKILVQKLFGTCVNQKFYHFCETNVTWGLKSQQVIWIYISRTMAQMHPSSSHPHLPPFKYFRLQKHSWPEICPWRINPKDRAQCFILSNGSRNSPLAQAVWGRADRICCYGPSSLKL